MLSSSRTVIRAATRSSCSLPFRKASGVRLSLNKASSRSLSSAATAALTPATGAAAAAPQQEHEELYDVVIVGGGMIGATMACALHTGASGDKLRILAIDSAKPPATPASFPSVPASFANDAKTSATASMDELPLPTLRTVALSPQSAQLLSQIGIWDGVTATGRVGAYDRMLVWDAHAQSQSLSSSTAAHPGATGSGGVVAGDGGAQSGAAVVEWRAADAAVFGSDAHDDHALSRSHSHGKADSAANVGGVSSVSKLGYVVENDILHSHVFAKMQQLAAQSRTQNKAKTAAAAAVAPTATVSSSAEMEEEPVEVAVSNPVWLNYYNAAGTLDVATNTAVNSLVLPASGNYQPPSSSATAKSDSASATTAASSFDDKTGPTAAEGGVTARFARLTLSNGRRVAARLVIGADGQSSLVKATAGLGAVGWDYNQRAAVATVALERPVTTAFQRFLPSGPVAVLPLYGNLANIVWSTNPAHSKHLSSCTPAEYLDQLNNALFAPAAALAPLAAAEGVAVAGPVDPETGLPVLSAASLLRHVASLPGKAARFWRDPVPDAFKGLLPLLSQQNVASLLDLPSNQPAVRVNTNATVTATATTTKTDDSTNGSNANDLLPRAIAVKGPRAGFPLKLTLGTAYVAPRVALIGDAAHVVHPMAGQGVNLGFGDVAVLAQELEKGIGAGSDVGDYHVLTKYQNKQGCHHVNVLKRNPVLLCVDL